MFKDAKWFTKIFIGGLWNLAMLIFVGIPFVLGYFLMVVENVIRDEEEILPDWSGLATKLQKGLLLCIIYFTYCLPVILISSLFEESFGESDALVLVLFMIILFWLPIVTINYAKTGDFMAAYHFNEMLNIIMGNIGYYIPMVLLSLAVIGFGFFLGSLLIGIGIPFLSFWAFIVCAHLFGQFGVYISKGDEGSEKVNV